MPQAGERWAVSPWNRHGVEESTAFARPPLIADCTLRDGEQQAGVVFSYDDKITLARRLDAIGVADIEAGTPAVSKEDRSAIEAIGSLGLNAMVTAVARATEADIDLVSSCGCAGVRISFPISERQRRAKLHVSDDEYIAQAVKFCDYAKVAGLQVIFSPYDTTRCDLDLLRRLLNTFAREGCVDRVRLVDTVGGATPEAVRFLVGVMLESGQGIPIEAHFHNDFGLGTANTIAAALAGASYLSVTVGGIGERSGNVALEEVVMSMLVLYGQTLGIRTEDLTELATEVERRSGVAFRTHKPIVGRGSFMHESGMVVAGLLKDPFTAEPFQPELVGQVRGIAYGKKSGRASIRRKLEELGIQDEGNMADQLLDLVKQEAADRDRALTDAEVTDLVQGLVAESGRQ